MITIENLTKKQQAICDILWTLDSKDQVIAFIASLPKADKADAVGLYHLMIIESLDQNMDIEDLSLAKQVIDKVK
jgi:hypothetical protein